METTTNPILKPATLPTPRSFASPLLANPIAQPLLKGLLSDERKGTHSLKKRVRSRTQEDDSEVEGPPHKTTLVDGTYKGDEMAEIINVDQPPPVQEFMTQGGPPGPPNIQTAASAIERMMEAQMTKLTLVFAKNHQETLATQDAWQKKQETQSQQSVTLITNDIAVLKKSVMEAGSLQILALSKEKKRIDAIAAEQADIVDALRHMPMNPADHSITLKNVPAPTKNPNSTNGIPSHKDLCQYVQTLFVDFMELHGKSFQIRECHGVKK